MKKIKFILLIIIVQLFSQSCKKEAVDKENVSSFTVINAVTGASPLIVDYSGIDNVYTYFSTTNQIGNASYHEYSMSSGNIPITIYQTSDTTHAFYKKQLSLQPGGIYSLFLSGTDPANPDSLLVKENIPDYSIADSVIGVRFINLSTGSSPISVNMLGKANGSEVGNLAYKSITAFETHPYTTTDPASGSYTFEFRDAETNSLLTTYTYNNIVRYKNVTIVMEGLPGGSGSTAQQAFLVNNY